MLLQLLCVSQHLLDTILAQLRQQQDLNAQQVITVLRDQQVLKQFLALSVLFDQPLEEPQFQIVLHVLQDTIVDKQHQFQQFALKEATAHQVHQHQLNVQLELSERRSDLLLLQIVRADYQECTAHKKV